MSGDNGVLVFMYFEMNNGMADLTILFPNSNIVVAIVHRNTNSYHSQALVVAQSNATGFSNI